MKTNNTNEIKVYFTKKQVVNFIRFLAELEVINAMTYGNAMWAMHHVASPALKRYFELYKEVNK